MIYKKPWLCSVLLWSTQEAPRSHSLKKDRGSRLYVSCFSQALYNRPQRFCQLLIIACFSLPHPARLGNQSWYSFLWIPLTLGTLITKLRRQRERLNIYKTIVLENKNNSARSMAVLIVFQSVHFATTPPQSVDVNWRRLGRYPSSFSSPDVLHWGGKEVNRKDRLGPKRFFSGQNAWFDLQSSSKVLS